MDQRLACIAPLAAVLCCGGGTSSPAGDDASVADAGQSRDGSRPGAEGGFDGGQDAYADAGRDASADSGHPIDAGSVAPSPVLQFHNHPSRDGVYTDPRLTRAAAASMHLDATFHATVSGNVNAQPLYATDGPGGKGAFIVATELNEVYALDDTGAQVWATKVAPPASGAEKCGNIKPLGITGTPVIDMKRRAVYVDAAVPGTNVTTLGEHEIHGLSLDTGQELAGWPVKASSVTAGGTAFQPRPQNQRGALLIAGDILYVPYGGHAGDCTDDEGDVYHGWILGVPLDDPSAATGWVTAAPRAGMWAVGGMASDGTNVFATTGNASAGQVCPSPPPMSPPPGWAQQEAVLRFQAGPTWSGKTTDYYAPLDWPCLDNADLDVGGSNPVLFDVPGGSPSQLVAALGKDGKIYLLDRNDLGGIGAEIASARVVSGEIEMAATAYTTAMGTYVVGYGYAGDSALGCPAGQSGNLVAVKVIPGTPPSLAVAWCADAKGQGSPIFTTSDGSSDPLVWAVGAEQDNRLHAWDADTGAVVFGGGSASDAIAGFHHFSTIIVEQGRIFAAGDGALHAFTPM